MKMAVCDNCYFTR